MYLILNKLQLKSELMSEFIILVFDWRLRRNLFDHRVKMPLLINIAFYTMKFNLLKPSLTVA